MIFSVGSFLNARLVFSLYVGVAFYGMPQDCKCGRLLFWVATFFYACFGVGYLFFFTCVAWFHIEAATVWMWKHVSFVF
jgi:hypothetical protein